MEKEINSLTKQDILNVGFLDSIFEEYKDSSERKLILDEIMGRAKLLKIENKFKKALESKKRILDYKAIDVYDDLEMDDNGNVLPTSNNFLTILDNDPEFKNLYYFNTFSNNVVNIKKDGFVESNWTDADDSWLRCEIEYKYKIYNQAKYYDAFNRSAHNRERHPIKEIIENDIWDGKPRIDTFLQKICKSDGDENYLREASRMIFYGGITRLYCPGYKFDYMPIFVGRQGCYKSTLVRWLALNDNYYNVINSIEGKDGVEAIQSTWICEMAELLAMVRTKEVEAMKSFITTNVDKYRPAYGRRVETIPRKTIFIGTTNDYEFLTDITGNRRYLPIEINLKPGELVGHENEVQDYILACWREALYLMEEHKTYTTIDASYLPKIEEVQLSHTEDDPEVGLITTYLENKKVGDQVCSLEIYTKCLNGLKKNYKKSESYKIARVMRNLSNWKREKDSRPYFEEYGRQRCWTKISESSE